MAAPLPSVAFPFSWLLEGRGHSQRPAGEKAPVLAPISPRWTHGAASAWPLEMNQALA